MRTVNRALDPSPRSQDGAASRRPALSRAVLCLVSIALAVGGFAPTAQARPYTVYACDAAGFWGSPNNSWSPAGSGTVESRCPSNADWQRGMTTRLVGSTYPAFTGAAYDFNAPPGTTITGLKWSGRYSRTNCTWHARMTAYPADRDLFGVRAGEQCSINSLDIASSIGGWSAPPGTTQLRQLVVCGASSCPTGATFHSRWMEVLLDDYTAPGVSVGGALAEGQWVRGRAVRRTPWAPTTPGVRDARQRRSPAHRGRDAGVRLQPDAAQSLPIACDRPRLSASRPASLSRRRAHARTSAPSTQPETRPRSPGRCVSTTRLRIRSNQRSPAVRAGGRRTSSTYVGPTARPNMHPSSRRTGRRARPSAACAAAGARRTSPL